ncbi:hypothetical protein D3C80_1614340 [compost metagenome]
MQIHRLLQVRQEQANQGNLCCIEVAAGVVAAGEQSTVHARGRAHVGDQDVAQIQGLQIVAVEVVGQPGIGAQYLVGTGHLLDRPVDEGADCVVLFAVERLAWQQGPMNRCIDDQPRPFMVGVA